MYFVGNSMFHEQTDLNMCRRRKLLILSPFAAEVRFDCMIVCLTECFYMSALHTHPLTCPLAPSHPTQSAIVVSM